MDERIKDNESVSDSYYKSDTKGCEIAKHDSVEKLKERIAELELELQRQQKAAEKGNKLFRVLWGHDFNDECLH